MDVTSERTIADLARQQHGCITAAQATAAGMSKATRARRLDRGLLVPVGATTYRLASAPATPEAALMAACLDLGAVVSHRSALWLHGLRSRPPERPEVSVRKGSTTRKAARSAEVVVHATTSLPKDDLTEVRHIPVTSVARSLLGLAALVETPVEREELEAAVETAVRTRLASDTWLWWLLENRRCRGRNGVTEMERVLARRVGLGPTESWLERQMLELLRSAGLPLPAVQRRIRRRGAFVARVDLLYEGHRVVIEVMGHEWHSSRPQREADTRRANELQLMGYVVIQITYDQLVGDPRSVVRTVREALAERTPRP